jgi:CheY-like chemotaxis protein
MEFLDRELRQADDTSLTAEERSRLRCERARRFERAGDFAAARAALGGLWRGVGHRPDLRGLGRWDAAELLLRAGVLTGRLGSAGQVAGAQEAGKNLITESLSVFEALGDRRKAAEAQVELGVCYWREGALDEARVLLGEALSKLEGGDDLKALATLRAATVESAAFRLHDALRLLSAGAPLFERSDDHNLKGCFHNERAMILRRLGEAEGRADYADRALVEYAAAGYHFERAGHRRYQACVENNLGFLFGSLGRFEEAHEHLDRARALFEGLGDATHLAQVDETRARVLLSEGRDAEAEAHARRAAEALAGGGHQSLLAEALTARGAALARTGRRAEARLTLERAAEVAELAGDLEAAGRAALTLVEEIGHRLAPAEERAAYRRADSLLSSSRHPAGRERLLRCARRVISRAAATDPSPAGENFSPETVSPETCSRQVFSWENFSLRRAVGDFEGRLVERALGDSGGVVTRAARLLGVSQQYLLSLLHARQRRVPPSPAPRETEAGAAASGGPRPRPAGSRPFSILYAEDRREVSEAVSESLELEGWRVEVRADGAEAAEALRGGEPFDLLLFDHDLPGLTGVELTRLARALPHRRLTPVVFFTASEVEAEARRAGADAFLRKPDDVQALAGAVALLLNRRDEK